MSSSSVRVIAFYLPQFHPIPENDEWWGKGFTEWTNVGKAMPYFKGHYQPRVPADLGYYDLRVPETRRQQADMAREFGIEGFCYWHYWFGNGRRLLERPFHEVVTSGEPDFPFCLAWANESWKGFAHGLTNRNVLIEQLYPGEKDHVAHFYAILPALQDRRYITVDGKPLFILFKPLEMPNIKSFMSLWQDLAIKNGLKGIFFVGQSFFVKEIDAIRALGFDGVNINRLFTYVIQRRFFARRAKDILNQMLRRPRVYAYKKMIKYFNGPEDSCRDVFPSVFPNWDHSPRSGAAGFIFHNSTPESFGEHVDVTFRNVKDKPEEYRIVFLKSWNEWAEGNYIEPDRRWGTKYLEVLRDCVAKHAN